MKENMRQYWLPRIILYGGSIAAIALCLYTCKRFHDASQANIDRHMAKYGVTR